MTSCCLVFKVLLQPGVVIWRQLRAHWWKPTVIAFICAWKETKWALPLRHANIPQEGPEHSGGLKVPPSLLLWMCVKLQLCVNHWNELWNKVNLILCKFWITAARLLLLFRNMKSLVVHICRTRSLCPPPPPRCVCAGGDFSGFSCGYSFSWPPKPAEPFHTPIWFSFTRYFAIKPKHECLLVEMCQSLDLITTNDTLKAFVQKMCVLLSLNSRDNWSP